jgi:hypothetical protein
MLPTIAWISQKDDLSTGTWKTHKAEFSTLSTIPTTIILFINYFLNIYFMG